MTTRSGKTTAVFLVAAILCLLGLRLLIWLPGYQRAKQEYARFNETAEKVNTDVAGLARLMDLPVMPEAVWFGSFPRGIQSRAPGLSDPMLVAVMRFDPVALRAFLDAARPAQQTPARIPKIEIRNWVPQNVRAALSSADTEYYVVNGRQYSAAPFSPKPGTQSDAGSIGSFFVLDDGRFVILRRAM